VFVFATRRLPFAGNWAALGSKFELVQQLAKSISQTYVFSHLA
jgi:hypothetical protein